MSSGQNRRRCIKKHQFKLLDISELKRNPVDGLYYYREGELIVNAECIRCGKILSNKTILKLLNKYSGVNKK